jgi:hypothetical protein
VATGITLIEPVTLPSGAAENYAGGDVRHISPTTDPLNGQQISATTRQLAERDNLLAVVVNQLVAAVNNKDQLVNLPLPTVQIAPGSTVSVSSFRIPEGFEARILNAAISSIPSLLARLDIVYNEGTYGALTGGVSLVSTLSEFTSGTSFYGTGEFLVSFVNTGGRTAQVSASVLLTLRPVAAQKGGIIGPGAVGAQGSIGPQGPKGNPGSPGLPGSTGPAGLTWRGAHSSLTAYAQRDAVYFNGSAYYALVANTNQTPPAPDSAPSAYWDLLARQGAQGTQGVTGTTGAQGVQGQPGTGPTYDVRDGLTAIISGAAFEAGTTVDGYEAPSSGSSYAMEWLEVSTYGSTPSSPYYGSASLQMRQKWIFSGALSFDLPHPIDGAYGTWGVDDVVVSATMHGTAEADGTLVPLLSVTDDGDQTVTVTVHAPTPAKVYVGVNGLRGIP